MSELSRRILQRRLELGLSQEELAQRMGYRSKSSITKLEKGVNDIPQSKVEEFAAALETTPAWLMGLDNTAFVPPGFEPLPEMVRVPLVGSIACGTPITAEQNIEMLHRRSCRMARRLCPDLPRQQHGPHHLRWRHRLHPLPAGGGAGRDRRGADRRRGHP